MNTLLFNILAELHRLNRSVASDFVRANVQEVALLASRGLITTRTPHTTETYGRIWRLTTKGLMALQSGGYQ